MCCSYCCKKDIFQKVWFVFCMFIIVRSLVKRGLQHTWFSLINISLVSCPDSCYLGFQSLLLKDRGIFCSSQVWIKLPKNKDSRAQLKTPPLSDLTERKKFEIQKFVAHSGFSNRSRVNHLLLPINKGFCGSVNHFSAVHFSLKIKKKRYLKHRLPPVMPLGA